MAEDRWQQLVADTEGGDVTPGKMFGSAGLRTGAKFFAIWWHEQLVVKLPPARLTELVEAGEGQPVEPMGGRRMNGWVVVGGGGGWLAGGGGGRAHRAAAEA